MVAKYKLSYKHDFTSGARVSETQIKEWKKQALEYFAEHRKAKFWFCCTGNTVLVAVKCSDCKKGITIFVSTNGFIEEEYCKIKNKKKKKND